MILPFSNIRVVASVRKIHSRALTFVTQHFIQQAWEYQNFYGLTADKTIMVINTDMITVQYVYNLHHIYNQVITRGTDTPVAETMKTHMKRLTQLLPPGFEYNSHIDEHDMKHIPYILVPDITVIPGLIPVVKKMGGGVIKIQSSSFNIHVV